MGLPEGMVKAVSPNRHNKPGSLSATTLLNGIKQIVLTERHWDEIEEDVSDRFWAILGTAVHSLLEHEGDNEFTEESLSTEVNGIFVTGRIDNYNMETATITDYKTASVWKVIYRNFEDWKKQGMIYAWLLERNNLLIERCRFLALLKDHSKTEARRKSDYPQVPIYLYEFDVTMGDILSIDNFISEKVMGYVHTIGVADDDIPPCTPEERWEKPAKYAVRKEGRKSAVRVLDSKDEAEQMAASLGKGHSVETRPGESVRCMGYCSCREFCNFYRDNAEQPELKFREESSE
jgi:hypothetical protein